MRDKMTTNYARASYTEIIDLQTINGQTSIIGIHTPTGLGPYQKLAGFFRSFRKYRYKGISRILMVPAANLPVDPLGLTGVQGTTDLMDPRDALNPIEFHGCHGESLDQVLNLFYANNGTGLGVNGVSNPSPGYVSASADKIEVANVVSSVPYYRYLTDPSWKKFGIQSGVKLSRLHPLTWKVARTMPMLPGSSAAGTGQIRTAGSNVAEQGGIFATDTFNSPVSNATFPKGEIPTVVAAEGGYRSAFVQEFTNGVTPLGWLPTVTFGANGVNNDEISQSAPQLTVLPKIFMGMLVLPPAYNVEQYFRMSIRHVFEFREFTQSLGGFGYGEIQIPEIITNFTGYYNWIDYTDTSGKKIAEISTYNEGTTLDCIGANSQVISDGVN